MIRTGNLGQTGQTTLHIYNHGIHGSCRDGEFLLEHVARDWKTVTQQDLVGRAADAGSKPAMHRNTYLITKEQGYDPAKNADWLNSVKSDAKARNAEAMFLLGQLYREGHGVKKDLMKSLELLKQVRILGVANVDTQIAIIEDEIEAINKKEKLQRKNSEQEVARVKQANMAKPADHKQHNLQKEAEARAQTEKIRRYEKAMMKLKEEQRLIDEQQAWAAGGDTGGADDEI